MTATTLELAPGTATWELRTRVRERLEQEYLQLSKVERPALLMMFDANDDDIDALEVGRAIAVINYRIAALRDHLGTMHEPHPDDGVCPDCCVLLDRGDGPQWFLLAALPEAGLPVIDSDSALGRAVIGARQGQVVHYATPAGLQAARVMALEYLD